MNIEPLLKAAYPICVIANTDSWYFSEIRKLTRDIIVTPEEIELIAARLENDNSISEDPINLINFFYISVFSLLNKSLHEAEKMIDDNANSRMRWIGNAKSFLLSYANHTNIINLAPAQVGRNIVFAQRSQNTTSSNASTITIKGTNP